MSRCLHQTTPADRVNQVRKIKGKGYNLQKTGLLQSPVFFILINKTAGLLHPIGFAMTWCMSLRGGQRIDRRSNPAYDTVMSEDKQYYVYILFSKKNGTLYVGVTSDLVKRVWQHKNKLVKGFTQKYNVDKLGYYEISNDINSAIAREKQLKGGNRQAKLDLIEINNPDWNDLYYEII